MLLICLLLLLLLRVVQAKSSRLLHHGLAQGRHPADALLVEQRGGGILLCWPGRDCWLRRWCGLLRLLLLDAATAPELR